MLIYTTWKDTARALLPSLERGDLAPLHDITDRIAGILMDARDASRSPVVKNGIRDALLLLEGIHFATGLIEVGKEGK